MTEAVITPDAGAEPVAAIETAASAAPEAPKADRSQDDKIRDALNAVGALDDAPDAPLKKPNVADQERNEGGQFKAKDAKAEADTPAEKAEAKPEPVKDAKPEAKATEAPAEQPAKPKIAPPDRFNDGAKAAWEAAPDEVRHEVVRMQRELEKGLTEYKTKAAEIEARDAPLKPFREMAERAGVKFEDALQNYVAAEQALVSNPMQALAKMAQQYVPGGLQAFVAQLTGQQAQNVPRDAQIAQLQQQIAQLSQGVQQTTQTLEQQRAAQAQAERQAVVDQFVAAHPRAQEPEIEAEMTRLLSSGYISADLPSQDRLSQAYDTATRLIPAPVQEPAPQAAPAQTRPAATSISGAPASGSSPRASVPPSPEQIAERALRKYGVI